MVIKDKSLVISKAFIKPIVNKGNKNATPRLINCGFFYVEKVDLICILKVFTKGVYYHFAKVKRGLEVAGFVKWARL